MIPSIIWLYKFLEIRELRVIPSERNENTITANPTRTRERTKIDATDRTKLTPVFNIFLAIVKSNRLLLQALSLLLVSTGT
jgi:hypothetical protein